MYNMLGLKDNFPSRFPPQQQEVNRIVKVMGMYSCHTPQSSNGFLLDYFITKQKIYTPFLSPLNYDYWLWVLMKIKSYKVYAGS